MSDTLHRFLFEALAVRGVFVRLDAALARNLASHPYPAPVRRLLAETTTAVALLSSTVKLKGRLSLQFQSQGPVRLLLAECRDDGGLRSLAQCEPELLEADFAALMAGGQMALSLIPDEGQSYQGVVPLDGRELPDCIRHYFEQSEQLATRLLLFFDGMRAAGLLIQALPGLSQPEDFERIALLAETLSAFEAFALPVETLLHRLYHEEEVRLFAPTSLRFQCRCSLARCRDSLRALGVAELTDLLQSEGEASMHCDFCSEHYRFDAAELQLLISELQRQLH